MDPITAAYAQDDADWTITVTGLGKTLTARAPGIIAARDRADQLAEKLAPQPGRTVVHLLNGSALDFTATYMQARLARPAPGEEQPGALAKAAEPKKPARKPAAKPAAAKPKRTKPATRRTAKPAADATAAATNGKASKTGKTGKTTVSAALDDATAVANQPAGS